MNWIGEQLRAAKLSELREMTVQQLRALWDSFDEETSFCGEYDCADVHAVLNEKGDGAYCAV
jgi:hypothetical protein